MQGKATADVAQRRTSVGCRRVRSTVSRIEDLSADGKKKFICAVRISLDFEKRVATFTCTLAGRPRARADLERPPLGESSDFFFDKGE